MDKSVGVSGSASVGNEEIGATIGGSVGIEVSASAHASVDPTGLSASAEYHEVAEASATVSSTAEHEGIGFIGSATAYAKTGTEVEGHVEAGIHGVDVGAEASIGDAAGVEGEVTESVRYASGTVGAGVSIGEHFEAGGSAEATFKHGIATVGIAGDLAAVVGLDVDAKVSVDTNTIVKDGKAVAKEAEVATKVVAKEAEVATKVVANETKTVTNTIASTTKKVTNSISKGFKKAFRL